MMPGGVKGTMARDVVKLVYKDLHNLVSEFASRNSGISSAAYRRMSATAKKLRPHSLSISNVAPTMPVSASSAERRMSHAGVVSPMKGQGASLLGGDTSKFQSSLVDLFFHQHLRRYLK